MQTLKEYAVEALTEFDHAWFNASMFDKLVIKYALASNKTVLSVSTPMSFNDKEALREAGKDIVTKIKEHGGYEFFGDDDHKIFMFEEGIVEVTFDERALHVHCSGKVTDLSLREYFKEITKKYSGPRKSKSSVYTIVDSNGLSLKYLSQFSDYDFEPENYEEDVVEKFHHGIEELASSNPCGRLMIVNGRPGTGKTNYIKGLITQSNRCNFVIVPFSASLLSNPSMVNLITSINIKNDDGSYRPVVFILEDADSALVPRGADNISDISTLLNLSDGVLGHLLDLRIIATTNAAKVDIDPALVRAGRLCQMIDINELSEQQANVVWTRLTNTGTVYTSKSRILADIYAAAKNKMPKKFQKTERIRIAGFTT